MKLAITADVHLRTFEETPNRYLALKDIFKQAQKEKAGTVLICGDLFDKNFRNFKDFEQLAHRFSDLEIWILPGNHDSHLSRKHFVGKNIRIFERTQQVGDNLPFLMIPFQDGKNMGQVIAEYAPNLEAGQWVLCGHGDYLDGPRIPNSYEKGIYMPLARSDREKYQPAQVFLGHIHAHRNLPIHYPGSPCGLDISETGQRRFLLYDTQTGQVESRPVENQVTYQSCTLTILPVEDEKALVHNLVADIKQKWEQDQPEKKKTCIRVKIQGVTKDISELMNTLHTEFKGFKFYKDEGFESSDLNITVDPARIKIAESTRQELDKIKLNQDLQEPDYDQILLESLNLIFED